MSTTIIIPLYGGESSATVQPVVNTGTLSTLTSFRNTITGESEGNVEMFPLRAQGYVPDRIRAALKEGDTHQLESLRLSLLDFFEEQQGRVAVQELLAALRLRALGENVDASAPTEGVLTLMHHINF